MTNERHQNAQAKYYNSFQNYYNCHTYMALTPYYYTDVRLKVHHWQLRDMLQVDQQTGQAFFNYEDKIKSIDLNQAGDLRDQAVPLKLEVQLEFQPRCFKQSNGGMMVFGGVMASGYKAPPNLISYSNHGYPGFVRSGANSDNEESGGDDGSPSTIASDTPMDDSQNTDAPSLAQFGAQPIPFDDSAYSKQSKTSTPTKRRSRVLTSFSLHRARSALGLLLFYNPHIAHTETVVLGDMINNSVSIYPKHGATGQYLSYVCNNDLNLYVVDVCDSHVSLNHKILCEPGTALNNVEMNPLTDKLLAVTGDLPLVFLVDPSSEKSCISAISTSCDSGFGVSFDSSGYLLATTFQDGTCLIYDIRNLPKKNSTLHETRPLHAFKLTRAGHQLGAFRCCKFLDTGRDSLLAVSEHVGRVHVVDLAKACDTNQVTANLGHQVIVLPYALDQYGHHMKKNSREALSPEDHYRVKVYEENDTNDAKQLFPAPLVYDYDYLTSLKSKLFKDFTYQPHNKDLHTRPQLPIPDINTPNWNMLSMDRMSMEYYNMNPRSLNEIPIQTPANHVNGEMELSGINWYGEKLAIACDQGGLLTWDMNIKRSRNSGNFSYV